MLSTIATRIRSSFAPRAALPADVRGGDAWPDAADVERRRKALRDAVLGFDASDATASVRSDLDRLGCTVRTDDITPLGISGWAPANTWALNPKPRREVWLVHRDRADPWLTDAHVFATLDGVTLFWATLMPTRMPRLDEGLMLRSGFGIADTDPEWIFAEDAHIRLAGRIPDLWATPSRWSIPRKGWLPAKDAATVSGTLAKLVSGMVETLEKAGPARGLMPAQAA